MVGKRARPAKAYRTSHKGWGRTALARWCKYGARGHAYLVAELLLEDVLERDGVGCKLADPLVELVERHLVLEQGPPELWLVVDEARLCDGIRLGCRLWAEARRELALGLLQLLEERRGNRQEVAAREFDNLVGLLRRVAGSMSVLRFKSERRKGRIEHAGLTLRNEAPMTMVL